MYAALHRKKITLEVISQRKHGAEDEGFGRSLTKYFTYSLHREKEEFRSLSVGGQFLADSETLNFNFNA